MYMCVCVCVYVCVYKYMTNLSDFSWKFVSFQCNSDKRKNVCYYLNNFFSVLCTKIKIQSVTVLHDNFIRIVQL